jgi:hypothetical protein
VVVRASSEATCISVSGTALGIAESCADWEGCEGLTSGRGMDAACWGLEAEVDGDEPMWRRTVRSRRWNEKVDWTVGWMGSAIA